MIVKMQAVLEWIKNYVLNIVSSPAQIIGFAGLLCSAVAFQQRERNGILQFQLMAAVLFCIHFFMLGGYSGMAINLLSAVRTVVYYNKEQKWAQSLWWPVGFMLAFTAATAGIAILIPSEVPVWYNIFPLIGAYVYTLATYSDSAKVVRRTLWISSVVWIVYNVSVGSVAGVVTECIALTSEAVSIVRFDILRK